MLVPPGVTYPTDDTTINLTRRAGPALASTTVSGSLRLFCLGAALLGAGLARGQQATQNQGFSLLRYEPTPAGEWTFWADHPWYSQDFNAAAGLTFDYAHDPLVFGTLNGQKLTVTNDVLANALLAHVDLAGSLWNRVTASISIPMVLWEGGTAQGGFSPAGFTFGDGRVGAMVRLYGDPLLDAFSVHLGVDLWIPFGTSGADVGSSTVRVLPKAVVAGFSHNILWSANFGFMYQPTASLGNLPPGPGNTIGSELRLDAAVGYMDPDKRFSIGPEAALASVVNGGDFFQEDYTSLELCWAQPTACSPTSRLGLRQGWGSSASPARPTSASCSASPTCSRRRWSKLRLSRCKRRRS